MIESKIYALINDFLDTSYKSKMHVYILPLFYFKKTDNLVFS